MRFILACFMALLLAVPARAGDVYVVTDADGNRVYTDRPQSLPAEKAGIRSSSTDPAAVQARYGEQMKRLAADDRATTNQAVKDGNAVDPKETSPEDRARLCADARKRYETVMSNFRIYETGPNGERRYLDSAEIDAARANAKRAMDGLCSGQ